MPALLVAGVLVLAACSASDSSSSDAATTSSTRTAATRSPAWARLDRALAEMAPDVGFLAARVSPDGTCEPVHEVEPTTARPVGSQFKLFVLGALAEQIVDGRMSWDHTLTIDDTVRSIGNTEGSLQFEPNGTDVSVEQAAMNMISISDNTATDMLIDLVGREAVEAQDRAWSDHAALNVPFLETRQMFLLHYARGLADQYLALPRDERGEFLASSVDPRPMGDIASAFSQDPRYIDEIEWFASPTDICEAFAGLQELSTEPALSPELSAILSREARGIGLDESEWPTVWYKGGSEPGVLAMGWLATNRDGTTYVVEATVSNPDAVLAESSLTDLVALGRQAFGELD